MSLFLSSLSLFIGFLSAPDQPRYRTEFRAQGGPFKLELIGEEADKEEWALTDTSAGIELYRIYDNISYRTAVIGPEGRSVVVIDDWSPRPHSPTLDVLHFYSQGDLVQSYSLGELLEDPENVSFSVSHFDWGFPARMGDDQAVHIKTFELIEYIFDSLTGKIIKRTLDSRVTEDAIVIYGKISRHGQGSYSINTCRIVHGDGNGGDVIPFTFESDNFERIGNTTRGTLHPGHHTTVILRQAKFVANVNVSLNACQ